MSAKLRSWWKQINQHRIAIGVVAIVLMVITGLIITGYLFDWTGFNGYTKVTIAHTISGTNAGTITKTEESQPGKALWDWLQLLVIPAVLAVGAFVFNFTQIRTEQDIATDKQREDLLQTYLDRMTALLLDKELRSSKPDAEVRTVARARTLTILPQLDAERQRSLVQFLSESQLLQIIDLSGAQLDHANLYRVNLSGAHLNYASLNYANLFEASIVGANLSDAHLINTSLVRANLSDANLSRANLTDADLSDARLFGANLSNTYLNNTRLNGANLSGANLMGIRLSKANLKDVIGVNVEELEKEVVSLEGTIMPDGKLGTTTE